MPAQSQSVMFAGLSRLLKTHMRDLVTRHLTPLSTASKCSAARLLMCNWQQANVVDMLPVTRDVLSVDYLWRQRMPQGCTMGDTSQLKCSTGTDSTAVQAMIALLQMSRAWQAGCLCMPAAVSGVPQVHPLSKSFTGCTTEHSFVD